MVSAGIFKKAILVSLLGHITIFSILSLSFGHKIPQANFVSIYFWGQFLPHSQMLQTKPKESTSSTKVLFMNRPNTQILDKIVQDESPFISRPALKPQVAIENNLKKQIFVDRFTSLPPSLRKKESTIVFHPLLPYGFTLYFKDRQVAHVELMFKIISTAVGNSLMIKRKISSGNLEVDLLTMRYMSRYLFMQQARFNPDNWQTVKVDLSAKDK